MITFLSSLPLSILLFLPGTALLVDPNFTVSVSMVTAISAQIDWTVPEVNDSVQYRLQIKKDGKYTIRIIHFLFIIIMYNYKLLSHIVHPPYYFFSVESDFDPDQYTVFSSSVRTTSLTNLSPNTSYELRMTRIEGGGCTRRVTEIEEFETLGKYCLYTGIIISSPVSSSQ